MQVVLSDITNEKAADAIVNVANSDLIHDSGIAGVIVLKGGQTI